MAMSLSRYSCFVLGESVDRVQRWHASTLRRATAFAFALHLPVLMWAISGYLIARHIFFCALEVAALASLCCAGTVYLLERIVLASPKTWYVSTGRVCIGLVVATVGASSVDLLLFDREIDQQLRRTGLQEAVAQFEGPIGLAQAQVWKRESLWLEAQARAECEANGTCGTRSPNTGPVYAQLRRHADALRRDLDAASEEVRSLKEQRQAAEEHWRSSKRVAEGAGLLARINALHDYVSQNRPAQVAWGLLFLLVMSLELMVVLVKLAFGKTVDDEIEQAREAVSRQRADDYVRAVTAPDLAAQIALRRA